ncbi:MAG: hypothetical protein OXN18_07680 [Gemmatimonadota bacterium]|nr:hypothetical protein [Gemmatimonadota bacterium]
MSDDLKRRIDAIEEGYEFFLAYAAQGLADDSASKAGEQVRTYLRGFEEALDGLDGAFRRRLLEVGAGGATASADPGDGASPAEAVDAALGVLRRDAAASRALVRLVAAQTSVSSQLIDNLNASIHVRALLTDVFVLGELVGV